MYSSPGLYTQSLVSVGGSIDSNHVGENAEFTNRRVVVIVAVVVVVVWNFYEWVNL